MLETLNNLLQNKFVPNYAEMIEKEIELCKNVHLLKKRGQ